MPIMKYLRISFTLGLYETFSLNLSRMHLVDVLQLKVLGRSCTRTFLQKCNKNEAGSFECNYKQQKWPITKI